jgi:hypothetical protein
MEKFSNEFKDDASYMENFIQEMSQKIEEKKMLYSQLKGSLNDIKVRGGSDEEAESQIEFKETQ